ncbi:MAG: hypoxanthine phosphoribosyltransferase [Betaproteobacteria bacterium]|jgi:hypoxanthine phosphoribosyltransferase|nr:hypoxanthine phosphoribosyltransferase [Betaproteobacteria bacterium]
MPDVEQAWDFLRNSDPIASAEQVQAAVDRVAAEIEAKLGKTYPLALAVMGGAVVFAGQLLPRLRFPLDFDYVHASRYGSATRGAGIEWRVSPPTLAKGRTILVIDDILDHGETMAAIRARLLELGAQGVYCAVLVEKILDRKKPIHADFVGLSIPDRFVFGCGMDAKGFWRNLPEIRAMKEG